MFLHIYGNYEPLSNNHNLVVSKIFRSWTMYKIVNHVLLELEIVEANRTKLRYIFLYPVILHD